MKSALPTKIEKLSARLGKRPQLRQWVERLLDLCEDRAGDLRKADEAEERVVEEMRALGHEVLEGWAREQLDAPLRGVGSHRGGSREGRGAEGNPRSYREPRLFRHLPVRTGKGVTCLFLNRVAISSVMMRLLRLT